MKPKVPGNPPALTSYLIWPLICPLAKQSLAFEHLLGWGAHSFSRPLRISGQKARPPPGAGACPLGLPCCPSPCGWRLCLSLALPEASFQGPKTASCWRRPRASTTKGPGWFPMRKLPREAGCHRATGRWRLRKAGHREPPEQALVPGVQAASAEAWGPGGALMGLQGPAG